MHHLAVGTIGGQVSTFIIVLLLITEISANRFNSKTIMNYIIIKELKAQFHASQESYLETLLCQSPKNFKPMYSGNNLKIYEHLSCLLKTPKN